VIRDVPAIAPGERDLELSRKPAADSSIRQFRPAPVTPNTSPFRWRAIAATGGQEAGMHRCLMSARRERLVNSARGRFGLSAESALVDLA